MGNNGVGVGIEGEKGYACLDIPEEDLRMLAYLINAGKLRIKEQCNFKRLDEWDTKTMKFAEWLMKEVCGEYCKLHKKEDAIDQG